MTTATGAAPTRPAKPSTAGRHPLLLWLAALLWVAFAIGVASLPHSYRETPCNDYPRACKAQSAINVATWDARQIAAGRLQVDDEQLDSSPHANSVNPPSLRKSIVTPMAQACVRTSFQVTPDTGFGPSATDGPLFTCTVTLRDTYTHQFLTYRDTTVDCFDTSAVVTGGDCGTNATSDGVLTLKPSTTRTAPRTKTTATAKGGATSTSTASGVTCPITHAGGYRLTVDVARGDVSCGTANTTLDGYYNGHGTLHNPTGPAADQYVILDGWKCVSGAGGATCAKGNTRIDATN